jgi:DNA polymerase-3 subunit gamma/tau
VRDGLSLLDQAIALSGGAVEAAAVRDMLGIADRNLVWHLFETVMRGAAAGAIAQMDSLYQGGADPAIVLQDLLDLTHFVTRLKLTPAAGAGDPLEEGERERAGPLAASLSMPVLARAWQMLLKGLEEVQTAPAPAQAASMVLVRLAYVADLPAPAELVRSLAGGAVSTPSAAPGERAAVRGQTVSSPSQAFGAGPSLTRSAGEGLVPEAPISPGPTAQRIESAIAAAAMPLAAMSAATAPQPLANAELDPPPQSFAELVALFDKRREALLRLHLWTHCHLVSFEPGRIEFRPAEGAPRDLANRLMQLLGEWTGTHWVVAVSQAEGEPSLAEQAARRDGELRNEVASHPLVRAVLDAFPGATIAAVRERFAESGGDAEAAAGDAGVGFEAETVGTEEDEA